MEMVVVMIVVVIVVCTGIGVGVCGLGDGVPQQRNILITVVLLIVWSSWCHITK